MQRHEVGNRVRQGLGLGLATVLLLAVVVWSANNGSRDDAGRGLVIHYLAGCLGLNMETGDGAGQTYAIAYWPPGYSVKYASTDPLTLELADSGGATVLRQGDTVDVHLRVVHATGDTPCYNTGVVTVLDFKPVPSASPSG